MNPGSGVGGRGGGGVGVRVRVDSLDGGGPSLVFDGGSLTSLTSLTGSGVLAFGGDGGGLAMSFVSGLVGRTCLGVVGGRDSASEGCLLETIDFSVGSRSNPGISTSSLFEKR